MTKKKNEYGRQRRIVQIAKYLAEDNYKRNQDGPYATLALSTEERALRLGGGGRSNVRSGESPGSRSRLHGGAGSPDDKNYRSGMKNYQSRTDLSTIDPSTD